MTQIIEYAKVSPAVLSTLVSKVTCNALCMWKDISEDYFEFEVIGWLPLTTSELVAIEGVLAPYV